MAKKVRVAIVGLGFGAEFIPIYQAHPDAEMAAVCRRDKAGLDECGDKFGIKKRFTSFEDMLGRAFPAVPLTPGQVDAVAAALAGDVPTVLRRFWDDRYDDLVAGLRGRP